MGPPPSFETAASPPPQDEGGKRSTTLRRLRHRFHQRRDVAELIERPQPLAQVLRPRGAEHRPTRSKNFAVSPASSSGTMRDPSASSAWRVKLPRAVVTVTRAGRNCG